jgi:hypothetical protein
MKKKFFTLYSIIFITITMGLTSCHDLKKKADLIIFNAKIYTPDSVAKGVNCIAVKEGKIIGIGSDADIRSRYWAPENINAS